MKPRKSDSNFYSQVVELNLETYLDKKRPPNKDEKSNKRREKERFYFKKQYFTTMKLDIVDTKHPDWNKGG